MQRQSAPVASRFKVGLRRRYGGTSVEYAAIRSFLHLACVIGLLLPFTSSIRAQRSEESRNMVRWIRVIS